MSFLFPFCPLLCGQRTNIILEHIKNCKNKNLLSTKYFQCPYNPTHIFGKKVIEDEEEENDNNLNQPKRHNTSINLDRYHNNSTLKELLFKPESRNSIRKKSEIYQISIKKN